jgi:hypothetical protein
MKVTRGDVHPVPFLLGSLCLVLVSVIAAPALANERLPATTGPGSAWATKPLDADEGTDTFFTLAEDAWEVGVEYFVPIQSYRPIDVAILQLARAWRFSGGLELQVGGGIFQSFGNRTDLPAGASTDSTVTGGSAGGGIRYQLVRLAPVALFVDGSLQILLTPKEPFPAGGSGLNGFLRGGLGLSCDLTSRFALEIVYHVAHVSNASGEEPQNPGWTGQGGGVMIRYRFPR